MPRWDGYGIGGNFATGEPTRATEISLGSKEIERYPEGENGSSSILIAVMGLLRNVRELLRSEYLRLLVSYWKSWRKFFFVASNITKGICKERRFLDAMFGLCRDTNKLHFFFLCKRRLLTKDYWWHTYIFEEVILCINFLCSKSTYFMHLLIKTIIYTYLCCYCN